MEAKSVGVTSEEFDEARASLDTIVEELHKLSNFFRRLSTPSHIKERLNAYGLANAFTGVCREHDWVSSGYSIEEALYDLESHINDEECDDEECDD